MRRARATTATVVPGVTYIHTYIQPYINTYIHACIYAREPVQVHLEHRAHRFSPYHCLDFRCPSPCPRDARPRTGKDQSTTLCSGWAAVTATRAVRARLGRPPRHNKTLDCRPSHILLENNEMRVSSASSGRPASPARSSLDPNKAACSLARARGLLTLARARELIVRTNSIHREHILYRERRCLSHSRVRARSCPCVMDPLSAK